MAVIIAAQISLKEGYKPTKKAVTISKLVGAAKPLARSNHASSIDQQQFIKQPSTESVVSGNGQQPSQPHGQPHGQQTAVQAAGLPPLVSSQNGRSQIGRDVSRPIRKGVDVQGLMDDVRKLKIIAKGHERRIKFLEEKLATYEDEDKNDD